MTGRRSPNPESKVVKKFKVMLGRPVGQGSEKTDVGTFLMQFALFCRDHPRIEQMCEAESVSSRILLNRNIIMAEAIKQECDFLLMIDPDMSPDMYGRGEDRKPFVRDFLESSFKFLLENPFNIIAAPASGDPPKRLVNVFTTNLDGTARRMTHTETRDRWLNPSIEQVHAIGTGLILIHMPVIKVLEQPYFDDVYANVEKTELSLSQDIYFTQNLTLAGVGVFCNWYSFAGHIKSDVLGVPEDLADEEEANNILKNHAQNAPVPREEKPLPVTLDGCGPQPEPVRETGPQAAGGNAQGLCAGMVEKAVQLRSADEARRAADQEARRKDVRSLTGIQ